MRAKGLMGFVLLAALTLGLAGTSEALAQVVIGSIRVEGTQRIEEATVRSYLAIKEGDPFDGDRINKSLKGLFATGLFADAKILRDGDALVVTVVENPIVNRVAFEGNRRIKDENLQSEVQLRPRSVYTRTRVLADVERIQNVYRRSGRYAASIEPKIIQREQNRVDVVFEIDEGPVTYVSKISFNGNKHYSSGKLRDQLLTKEEAWYRILSSTDTYDPQRMSFDKEKLRRFYLAHGYADFTIESAVAELSSDRSSFFLTFTIDEGERYSVSKIDFETTLPNFDPSVLREDLTFAEGDWYNADAVENTVQKLTTKVGTFGYAFVDIKPDVRRDPDNHTVSIVFNISEGPRVYVERIEIIGNLRTLDSVIRREFRLIEGDPFNAAKVRRTQQRLNNLGFFKKAEITNEPSVTSPDKVVLKVKVEEKSTGSLMVGGGYSSEKGALVTFGISENNLLGRGQQISLNAELAQYGSEYDVSFTEPYFLGRELAAGVDLFHITKDLTDYSSYDYETTGFALRMGYNYSEELRHGWKYTLRQDKISDVESDASTYIKEQEGTSLLSMVGHKLVYDKRDSTLDPTEGYVITGGNDVAGFGGSNRFLRTDVAGAQYFNLADGYVLGLGGRVGYMAGLGRDVKIASRYFLGGEKSMRGFATAGISPRDKATNDALGSNWMTYESVELSFPLGTPEELGLSAKAFVDVGTSGKFDSMDSSQVNYSASPRMAIGMAFVWKSPMGPINLSLGYPLVKQSYDDTEVIQFNFGTRF